MIMDNPTSYDYYCIYDNKTFGSGARKRILSRLKYRKSYNEWTEGSKDGYNNYKIIGCPPLDNENSLIELKECCEWVVKCCGRWRNLRLDSSLENSLVKIIFINRNLTKRIIIYIKQK